MASWIESLNSSKGIMVYIGMPKFGSLTLSSIHMHASRWNDASYDKGNIKRYEWLKRNSAGTHVCDLCSIS